MKSFIENKKAVAPLVPILVIAVIAVVIFAFAGGNIGTSDDSGDTDDEIKTGLIDEFTGDVTYKLKNFNGSSTITSADTSDLTVYLTKPDYYTSTSQVMEALDDENGLVHPFNDELLADTASPNSDGDVTFTDVVGVHGTDGGEQYGIIVVDSSTSVGADTFNTIVGTTLIEGYVDGDDINQVKIASSANEGASVGSTITLYERGEVGFYKDGEEVTGYNRAGNDEEYTDVQFSADIGLGNDYSVLENAVMYIDVVDDVANTADVEVVDVKFDGKEVKLIEMDDFKDTDEILEDAITKNAPSETGVLHVCEFDDGLFFDSKRVTDLYGSSKDLAITADADVSAATDDEGQIIVTIVGNNVHKNYELETVTFTISIDDTDANNSNVLA